MLENPFPLAPGEDMKSYRKWVIGGEGHFNAQLKSDMENG
jgi:hypothetical protein